jgi:hypothetical protein
VDNRDGTLSIFTTNLDHAAPTAIPESGASAETFAKSVLAAIGRTITFNDPHEGPDSDVGDRGDRNTELLIRDPRTKSGGGGDPGDGDGDGPPDGDGAGNQDAGEEDDADLAGGASGPMVGGDGSAAGDDAGGLPFTGLALAGLLTLALALLAAGSLARRARRR